MNQIESVIQLYRIGVLTRNGLFDGILPIITEENVGSVVEAIPEEFRSQFIQWVLSDSPEKRRICLGSDSEEAGELQTKRFKIVYSWLKSQQDLDSESSANSR